VKKSQTERAADMRTRATEMNETTAKMQRSLQDYKAAHDKARARKKAKAEKHKDEQTS
jgi:hypothetical protein